LRRARQQAEIVVGQPPVLMRLDARPKRAKRRTGAAGKVGDRHRRPPREHHHHRIDHSGVARTKIVRFA